METEVPGAGHKSDKYREEWGKHAAQGFMVLSELGPFDGVWIVWGQQGSPQLH